jgi:hypothetical protein
MRGARTKVTKVWLHHGVQRISVWAVGVQDRLAAAEFVAITFASLRGVDAVINGSSKPSCHAPILMDASPNVRTCA